MMDWIRQLYRLMARYRADGGSGLVHKARGRTSNRSINSGIRQYAIDLVKSHYADGSRSLPRIRRIFIGPYR